MIKAILFDCFGVVYTDNFAQNYNSFGGDAEADNEFLEQLIFDVSSGKVKSASAVVAEKLGIDADEWRKVNRSGRVFNQELLEYTKELREKYKIGMLTNVGVSGLEYYMDRSVVEEHFDVIVESAKIGFAKPEARAYEIAAERLGVRLDEIIFTDDREVYVEGARAVGMKAILFKDAAQFRNELMKIL